MLKKAKNINLRKAKAVKNDEFYTQLTDIEKEMHYHRDQFKDKVIYCNCDDHEWSNFYKYFQLGFEFLGIKKLIATSYKDNGKLAEAMIIERDDVKCPINSLNTREGYKYTLKQNGDFRSPEAIEFLKEADIVITNPPFSLFDEYLQQLITYNKKFLIIGPFNNLLTRNIFPMVKDNKVWTGYSPRNMEFITPSGELKGVNTCWYTNIPTKKRYEKLFLHKKYNEQDYPKYDNYDAIEVSKVADIPCDYDGRMGVPVTFLEKFNPEQFEIIDGISRYSILHGRQPEDKEGKLLTEVDGNPKFARVIIKRKAD